MSEEFFERLKNQYKNSLPFVVYKKPRVATIKTMLQNDDTLHEVSDFTEIGFVFAPFDDHEKTILIPLSESEILKIEAEASNPKEKLKTSHDGHDVSKQFHLSIIQKAIDEIEKGSFQKVVLSRSEKIPIPETNPIEIFKKLLIKYPTAFVYCWFHPKIGLWLGATPESLLTIESNRLTTMSLAGTRKCEDSLATAWQEKEKVEQQIVTDFIVQSLNNSVANIKISDVETIRAGNLLHLQTKITAKLISNSFNFKSLLNTLHPTPAVCGLPKEKAKDFILENENYNREYYTGFLGEINLMKRKARNPNRHNIENDVYTTINKMSDLYVNLRCMQIIKNHAKIYIGGGITKDSIPEKEWEETVSKSQVIKSIL